MGRGSLSRRVSGFQAETPGVCEGLEGVWVREERAFSGRLLRVEKRRSVELGWTRILFPQLEMTHSSPRNWFSKVLLGSFH